MGQIDSRQNSTLVAPDGSELRRGDYLPPSYAGGMQVVQCPNCDTFAIGSSHDYQIHSRNPYRQRCSGCDSTVVMEQID